MAIFPVRVCVTCLLCLTKLHQNTPDTSNGLHGPWTVFHCAGAKISMVHQAQPLQLSGCASLLPFLVQVHGGWNGTLDHGSVRKSSPVRERCILIDESTLHFLRRCLTISAAGAAEQSCHVFTACGKHSRTSDQSPLIGLIIQTSGRQTYCPPTGSHGLRQGDVSTLR